MKIEFDDLQEVCKYKHAMSGISGWHLGCLKRNRCWCCKEECPQITREYENAVVYIDGEKVADIREFSFKIK